MIIRYFKSVAKIKINFQFTPKSNYIPDGANVSNVQKCKYIKKFKFQEKILEYFYNVGIFFQAYEAQYLFLKRFALLAKYTVKTSIWKTTHYNLS